MAFGPLSKWRQSDDPRLYRPLIVTMIVSVVAGLVWPVSLSGQYSIATAIGVTLALWLAIATAVDFVKKTATTEVLDKLLPVLNVGCSVCGSLI